MGCCISIQCVATTAQNVIYLPLPPMTSFCLNRYPVVLRHRSFCLEQHTKYVIWNVCLINRRLKMFKLNCALWLCHAKCWRRTNRYFCLSDLVLSRVGLYKHSVGLLHKFLANRQDLSRIPITSFMRACRLYGPFVVPRGWIVGGKNFQFPFVKFLKSVCTLRRRMGEVHVLLHLFLTLAPSVGEWSALGRGRPTHDVRATGTCLIGGWMIPLQSQSGRFGEERNLLSLTGFELRIVHPRHWLRHPGFTSLLFGALYRCFLNCVMSVSLGR